MRLLILAAAFACCAAGAHAQTLIAHPIQAGSREALFDRASFPRQIERGDAIAEYRLPAPPRMAFTDATANELPLERMTLEGGGDIYCGSSAESAAAAAAIAAGTKGPPTCFTDSNGDGAADQLYAVTGTATNDLQLAAPAPLASPRAWREAPAEDRRLRFVYGGPISGDVLQGDRIGNAVVEVALIVTGDAEPRPMRAPLPLYCLDDSRCLPIPLAADTFVMIANPTVEGAAEARLVTREEAEGILQQVSALIAQRRAEVEARNTPQPKPDAAPAEAAPPAQ